jgi:CHAT domain-containing protein
LAEVVFSVIHLSLTPMRQSIIRLLIVVLLFSFAAARSPNTAFADPNGSLGISRGSPNLQTSTPSQTQSIELRIGEPLNREIARDETQAFTVELSVGQYAEVIFEWRGISLSVALFDPSGVKTIPANVEVSSPGPVTFSILAETSGTYQLQVSTPVKQKINGKYQLELEAPRLPTDSDRQKLAAQTQIAEAQNASDTKTRVQNYIQALARLQEAGDLNGQARVSILLGDVYRSAREKENARASYEQAATIWKGSHYPRGEAYARVSLGHFYRSFISAKDAVPHYEQAQLLFARIGDRRGQADALFGRAFALMLMRMTPDAIEVLQQILELRRADSDRMGEGSALNMMADAYRQLGDFEKSLALYDQASLALKGLEHRSLETILINNRALVLQDQGYWQEARDEFARVIAAYESLLAKPVMSICVSTQSLQDASSCGAVAIALNNLGETYNSLGETDTAVQQFTKSLLISDALKQPDAQGEARFHLGYAHFLLGNTDRALEYYLDALRFQEKNEAAKALTYVYLGMVHSARNEHEFALEFYQKASKIQMPADGKPSGDKRALAITLDKLASGYSETGNVTEASANYALALGLWRATKDPEGEALTLYHIAAAEEKAHHLAEASQNAEAAIKIVESLRTRLTSQRLRASYLASQADYYQLNVDLKMQLAKLESRSEYFAEALEANEKARARVLLDALSEAKVGRSEFNQNPDPRFAALIEQRRSLLEKLGDKARARSRLLAGDHTSEQIAVIDRQIEEISERSDGLEGQIRSQSPRFAALTKPQPSTLTEIQQQLEGDTLLLEYSLGEKRSYVWVVTPDLIHGFELPAREKIEEVAHRFSAALTARNKESGTQSYDQIRRADAESAEASKELSKLVLDPVASLLGQKRLVVVADGALHLVPFAALPAPGATVTQDTSAKLKTPVQALGNYPRFLFEDHEIVNLPSASILAVQRREHTNRKPAPHAVAVLADPVFDEIDMQRELRTRSTQRAVASQKQQAAVELRKPPTTNNTTSDLSRALRDVGIERISWLPFSRAEAEAILKLAPRGESMAALGFDASRATVTSPRMSNYQIIHFATHGMVNFEHPELSGIVLSLIDEKGRQQDGFLRLQDIFNLNLPAELVVLSACETGIGKQIKGEGLIALTRGFMYAGAPRVVASLWKVNDRATAELMAEFYSQMFIHGRKPAAALREAQRKLSRDRRWRRSPYYWAAFVIQGEWK